MKDKLKTEILNLLKPIFGTAFEETLEKFYDEKNPGETLKSVRHILVDFMGEENANNMLQDFLKKFPKLKIKFS